MLTNREFSKTDSVFIEACQLAGIEPTRRQASKWNRRTGLAYAWRGEALRIVTARGGAK
jgi:hypothetical protein